MSRLRQLRATARPSPVDRRHASPVDVGHASVLAGAAASEGETG